MAEFLQQGAGGQVHIQQAVVELAGIHIDAFRAGVADRGIGSEGASEFVIAAQIHRDLEAVAADRGDQVLQVGCKDIRIGAGMAEHIGEEGIAVFIAEQVRQIAAGIGERLLPDRLGFGIEGRIAARQHVLLRGLLAAAEVHQQRCAAGEGAVADAEIERVRAAGAEAIQAPVAPGLKEIAAAAAVEIERAVDTGLAEVVADALEAGIRRHGAFKAIAEAGALGIIAGQGAAAGAEGIEATAIHKRDRRQAAQQGRIVHGHYFDAAGEVGVGGVQPAVVAAAAARARQHRMAVLGGGVAVVGVGEIHARGGRTTAERVERRELRGGGYRSFSTCLIDSTYMGSVGCIWGPALAFFGPGFGENLLKGTGPSSARAPAGLVSRRFRCLQVAEIDWAAVVFPSRRRFGSSPLQGRR